MNARKQTKRGSQRQFLWLRVSVLFALYTLPVHNWYKNSSSTADSQIAVLYSQAQEAQKRGEFRAAADKYSAILKLQPDAVEARVNLGLMHHLLGNYAEAAREFEFVLRGNRALFAPNLFLGLDLLQLHQPRRALPYLEHAQKLNPQEVQAALQLGRAYADLHDFEKASDWYLRAATMNSGSGEAWYGLGVSYLHLARAASDQLVKEGQGTVYALRLLAESLEERGWAQDAIATYRKVLASPSAPPCSRAELGFAYLALDDEALVPDAGRQFEQALRAEPGCLLARLGQARINFQNKDTATGLENLAEIWTADPNFFKINACRLWQAFDPERLNNFENALRHFAVTPSNQEMTRRLIAESEKSRQQGVDAFVAPWTGKDGDIAPSEPTAEEKGASPAQLYRQGHYTRCAQKLKPMLGKLRKTICYSLPVVRMNREIIG